MLAMLYRYAGECAECDGEGEVVVSSVQRDVDWWDETKGPCTACADIRELIKLVDPCGDILTRVETLKREAATANTLRAYLAGNGILSGQHAAEATEDDIAF
jgi:hypothetical protein